MGSSPIRTAFMQHSSLIFTELGIALLSAGRPTSSGAWRLPYSRRLQGQVKSACAWHGDLVHTTRFMLLCSLHCNRAAAISGEVQRCVPCADETVVWSGAVAVPITKWGPSIGLHLLRLKSSLSCFGRLAASTMLHMFCILIKCQAAKPGDG